MFKRDLKSTVEITAKYANSVRKSNIPSLTITSELEIK